MRIVSISGASSRAGKTALAASVISALAPARPVALKFTVTEDVFERCPRGTTCVVCDIDVPFRIVEDPAVLGEPGTDTDRLGRAGAPRVLWAIARRSAVPLAWKAVAARLDASRPVVLEGSTVVDVARPDLLLFVAHAFLSPARWKETTPALVAAADAVILNRLAGEGREPSPEVVAELRRHRAPDDLLVADVTRPLAHWAPALARRLAHLHTPLEAHAL